MYVLLLKAKATDKHVINSCCIWSFSMLVISLVN